MDRAIEFVMGVLAGGLVVTVASLTPAWAESIRARAAVRRAEAALKEARAEQVRNYAGD